MNLASSLAMGLDPSLILAAQGITADPWQRSFLLSNHRENILNCSRQCGKSTTVAALAVRTAIYHPTALVLILRPGLRQSGEFFRKVQGASKAVRRMLTGGQGRLVMLSTPCRATACTLAPIFYFSGHTSALAGYSRAMRTSSQPEILRCLLLSFAY